VERKNAVSSSGDAAYGNTMTDVAASNRTLCEKVYGVA